VLALAASGVGLEYCRVGATGQLGCKGFDGFSDFKN
jgi:hypothetical protein